ncbi:RiPP maturation radical SAM C-methyltransferase [Kutzneria sp. CA-103260]|uniref:RiPP maturation radical SAM C-methyltransferase n=1 Tax=Kutzneria sp. CA-103260 TaxID=2802641 RepID=UPI001BAC43D5|nr:RiPP maturation radical SAM C-methyltransferase [Kutzneria sp. CA-103260]QUQ64656.1 Bacterial transcriptional activator domain protein [Kutzneria sp. CA-103260]
MEFGLLGTVAVWRDGDELTLGSAQRRCVLSMLLLAPGQVVPAQRLREALWGDNPPPDSARNVVQGCVSQLRRMLADDPTVRLLHRPPGYQLDVPADRVDLHHFRAMVAAGNATAGDREKAELLGRALGCWRGEPLADVEDSAVTAAVRSALTEERLAAEEDLIEARLRLGHHREVIRDLTALVAAHPLRERLRAQHMLALFRSGRHAEALGVFADTRGVLVDELGIEPGPELQRLHRRVLAGDRSLLAQPADAPRGFRPPRQLPAAPGRLAGRQVELAVLRDVLTTAGRPVVVTIGGLAGVGKTALAVHFGHQCADRFPDGQLFLDLRGQSSQPLTPTEALAGLLRGLGRERIPADEQELAAAYRSELAGRRVLLVLDDARDADQITPLLPGAAGCLVLVTGRIGLSAVDATARLRLGGLDAAAGLETLRHWAGAGRVDAEPEAAATTVTLCAGLPLALREVGARLAARPEHPISALVARLRDPRRLAALSSVRTAFADSLRVLETSPDPVDRAAAEAFPLLGKESHVSVEPDDGAYPALDRLADHHLLEPGPPGSYRIHPLVRLFARELRRRTPTSEGNRMTRIVLVTMPFADWRKPSFALSQLSALARREFGDAVEVEVRYLNIDFAHYLGVDTYDAIAEQVSHLMTGIGDWLFRPVAFPDLADNADDYFQRYYAGSASREFREHILERRAGIADFCAELAVQHGLDTADIVGFTSMFAQHAASIGMARVVKRLNPNAVTLLGGANCEAPMGAVIAQEVDVIDAVFSGPALHSFPQYIKQLLDGTPEGVHEIPGVLTAQNCHEPRFVKAVGRDRSIDDYFRPDYSGFVSAFDANRDRLGGPEVAKPILFFETSRGCWWGQRSHCTFCGLNGQGMDYRAMAADKARAQFEWLFDEFSPWCQEFICTDNIMPKSYPREVFSGLDTPDGVQLFYEIKVPLSEHDMAVLAKAGVTRIQPGIEAMATSTLKLMNKGTTSFLNLQFLRSCLRHGISPGWNLLFGFPRESAEVCAKYVEDIPLMTHLPPPGGAHMVRFDRYSPYYDKADEYGLDLTPMDFYPLIYPFGAEQIARMAYFFSDRNISPYLLDAITWLKPLNEKVQWWQAMWEPGVERPELVLRSEHGRHWVHDTRDGTVRRVDIDAALLPLLRRLTAPVTPRRLADDLSLDPQVVNAHLDFLRANNLLFTEGERIMSLVMSPFEPSDVDTETPAQRKELPLVVVR